METKKSFILHIDSLWILDELSDEQCGQLFKMIYNYHNPDKPTQTQITQLVSLAFYPFKSQFERDLLSYEKVVERNKNNGKMWGRPKNKNPKKPKKPDSGNGSDSDKDNNNTTAECVVVLDFFNSTTWVNLKLTDKKKEQIKNRLKTFSIEEIQTAIKNRMTSKWHIDQWWTKDWDSLFCNDEKIDKMLNIKNEAPIKRVHVTTDYSKL